MPSRQLRAAALCPLLLLPPIATAQDAATQLPPVEVIGTGPAPRGFYAPEATTATRTAAPVRETPVSIRVVPERVIEDFRLERLRDVLENVSGVRPNGSIQGGTGYLIRGFADGRRVYRNGLNITGTAERTEFDPANIQQIEVLKGPASVLYGRNEPGGLINIVTRRPLPFAAFRLDQEFGSHNRFRTVGDATGPLTRDGSVLGRFVFLHQDSRTFRDFGRDDRALLAPSLTFRLTPDTTWTIDLEHARREFIADYGIPAIGDRPARIPRRRSFGDSNDPLDIDRRTVLGSTLTHRIDADWQVVNRFAGSFIHTRDDFLNPAPAFGNALRADGRTLDRNIFFQETDSRTFATNLDLTGEVRHGAVRHRLLFGFDLLRVDSFYRTFGNFTSPDPRLAIDVFAPRYGVDPALFDLARAVPTTRGRNVSNFRNAFYGGYAQDQVTIADRLHLLAGVRWDYAETGRGRGGSDAEAERNFDRERVRRTDREASPRLGLLYDLLPTLGAYVSWSRSFGANNGIDAAGRPQPPQRGEQLEAGLKFETPDRRLLATAAFFTLARQNQLTPDRSTPDPLDMIAIGRARSKGVELDVTGRVLPGLDAIATYAYTDTEVVRDASGLQGRALPNVPLHAGSVALRYAFEEGAPLAGLAVGGGVYAASARQGDATNTFRLPGYARVDALVSYDFALYGTRMRAQLTARNLFDTLYFENTDPNANVAPRLGIYPGVPREVFGSVRVAF